jgi:hypothetical protein
MGLAHGNGQEYEAIKRLSIEGYIAIIDIKARMRPDNKPTEPE